MYMEALSQKIKGLELVKIQNTYTPGAKPTYFYNIFLEGIDEPLLVSDVPGPIFSEYIGKTIVYKLNGDSEITDFDII